MKRRTAFPALVVILVPVLVGTSCWSASTGGEGGSSTNPATQSAPFATPSPTFNERLDKIIEALPTRDEPMDTIIEGLIEKYFEAESSSSFRIGPKHYFTDSSGTSWIGFDVLLIYQKEGGYEVPTAVVRRVPGGDWELAAFGTGPLPVPDEVAKGLGLGQ